MSAEIEPNGAKAWQLAFWIMSGVCIVGILSLTQAVIANDRIREAGDKELSFKIECILKELNSNNLIIMADLREIKTRIGIEKHAT